MAITNEFALVIGLVSPIGVDIELVKEKLTSVFEEYACCVEVINIATLPDAFLGQKSPSDKRAYVESAMSRMPKHRQRFAEILGNDKKGAEFYALLLLEQMDKLRASMNSGRKIYLVDGIKHPAEIEVLRKIFDQSFYCIGVTDSLFNRIKFKFDSRNPELTPVDNESALFYAIREIYEDFEHRVGSSKFNNETGKAYQLCDFFLNLGVIENETGKNSEFTRIADLIFAAPYVTPTADEHSMFMAYMYSLRSADLSRQVGAAITNKQKDIVAFGVNEVPKAFGGQYWATAPYVEHTTDGIKAIRESKKDNRDFVQGYDANAKVKNEIFDEIMYSLQEAGALVDEETVEKKVLHALQNTSLNDITEFGRVVHAEMSAITSAAKNGISVHETVMYCTTYPCHNCAKHIISSGIQEVMYIEPYPKSRANTLHLDAIYDPDAVALGGQSKEHIIRMMANHFLEQYKNGETENHRVYFKPYTGVGPRRFTDLFSMKLSSGHPLVRKQRENAFTLSRGTQSSPRLATPIPICEFNRVDYLSSFNQDDLTQLVLRVCEENSFHEKRVSSVIKYWNEERGFGHLKSFEGAKDYYFSRRDFEQKDSDKIKLGNIASFQIRPNEEGTLCAIELRFNDIEYLESKIKSLQHDQEGSISKGFIHTLDNNCKDYYFVPQNINSSPDKIEVGQLVKFRTEISKSSGKVHAIDVVIEP
ncbi:deaminase [Pseudoalteromonas fenneropenaei]|uniref:Deaminase n=1 Tax=Pseudoalteromonas fenneropenaei TaxID=1737459 RepID=A0ABV7CNJ9_9GAMM